MIDHASIIPLIGGATIAQTNVLQQKPTAMYSYEPFAANDQHIAKYYDDVPYITLDNHSGFSKQPKHEIINTVCPCAGLSSLSTTSSGDSEINDWMVNTADFVLTSMKPKVFWGENAPRLGTNAGKPVVDKLMKIANREGYTMTIYKTKSILHGLSQIRDRTFYFFWKGKQIPVFEYYERPHVKIEEQILSSARNDEDAMFNTPTNMSKPTDDPLYRYLLEEIEGGITHRQFFEKLNSSANVMVYIEKSGTTYEEVSSWMSKNGYDRWSEKCMRMHKKLSSGGNIMRKGVEVGKDHIGAFVGHYLFMLTHPIEDRYINVREALDIMKMPRDFVLQGAPKNLNMIAQNVPVSTAEDMVRNVMNVLDGKTKMMDLSFAVQNNKTQKMEHSEQSTLQGFLE